jgi:hypothetical protein
MRHRRMLVAAALLTTALAARAEHFEYKVELSGTYSLGGTDGCTPPLFDQPACPRPGSLSGMLSFDTPTSGDGSWSIEGNSGDITDFSVTLGALDSEALYGGVSVTGGAPNGSVGPLDGSESFAFDWATRTASYDYDFGDHSPNGAFSGSLSAVPEPAAALLLLAGLAGVTGTARRRARAEAAR